jgi:disulfide bond formation protein DsbB
MNTGPAGTTRSHQSDDPYKWASLGVLTVLMATVPVIVTVIFSVNSSPTSSLTIPAAEQMQTGSAQSLPGEGVYQSSCMVCHGPNGDGVPFLGKPLRNSEFVQTHSDQELIALIVDGRSLTDPANTSGAVMPPRGAKALSDDDIALVVEYLHSMQAEGEPFASVAAWDIKSETGGAQAGAAVELTEHAGYQLFVASCAACHGQGAEGIDGLGLPLTTSGFVRGESDKDLVTFIKMGRSSWDENNTTGLDMPPKGGNPAITDEQLQTIVDYLRAVQKQAMGS